MGGLIVQPQEEVAAKAGVVICVEAVAGDGKWWGYDGVSEGCVWWGDG